MGKSLSTYSEAAELLMERFPSLGLMVGTWSERDPIDEPLPPLEVEKAEALYFYGLGTGQAYFECKEWLKKSTDRQLIFLEDDSGIIASFLHHPDAVEVLSHPQVHLELFSKTAEEIEALANRFPVKWVEVAGLKSKKGLKDLKLKLLRKTALSHALHLDRLHGYQPFKNFVENIRHMPHSFYANGLKGAFKDIPALVCGAGPSLQKSMDVIRGLEKKALIIAGGSTLAALSSQGISPHFGMAIDPNLEEYRRLKNSFAFETPLLYSTRVHPSIFQTCNGPFGYMRSGIGGVAELWMEEELGLLEPLMGDSLPSETISVTAICIAWAEFLGCNPILIDGVDMAYTGNKRYASGVAEDETISFRATDREKSAADRILKRKDREGRPVFTAVRWIMESTGISKFAKECSRIRFVNTTEGGIGFKGIEYVPLEEAVAGFQEREIRELVHEKIGQSPMPKGSREIIAEKMEELTISLDRLIGYLQILAGEKRGSAALAEMELKEESAYLYLFYDIFQVLKGGPGFWKAWLDLALKYQQSIR